MEDTKIGEYEERLDKLVNKDKVRCGKCGNKEDFMVNELGHVFCNKCFVKIPNIRLDEMK